MIGLLDKMMARKVSYRPLKKKDMHRTLYSKIIALVDSIARPKFKKGLILPYKETMMKISLNQTSYGRTGVYSIYNLATKKMYIGSTSKGFLDRYRKHLSSLKRGTHYSKELVEYINVHGTDCLVFKVLEFCNENIKDREQYYLNKYFETGILYNKALNAKASMKGLKHTDETKKKISQAKLGTVVSDETKQKISDKLSKPVIQLDKQGKFIAQYDSIVQASEATNVMKSHISECCNNIRKTAGKFKWLYNMM